MTIEKGETVTYTRESASRFPMDFHFCPHCGSNVFWEPQRMPELIAIAVAAFADPDFPPPQQSVWTRDKHGWVGLPPEMAAFGLNPPPHSANRSLGSSPA